jgi:ribonucleases P/MRP protein subunit RPP40
MTNIVFVLRNLISTRNLPWISLTAHGFADSPISWSGYEHGYRTNGDNFLTFVIFPNNSFWLYAALGTNDMYS